MAIERKEVLEKDCWDLTPMYKNFEHWQIECRSFMAEDSPIKRLAHFHHRLKEGKQTILSVIKLSLEIDRCLSKLYTYAHLLFDQDHGSDDHKKAFEEIRHLYYEFSHQTAWFEPELLQLPVELLESVIASKEMADYKIMLEKIVRLKPHTLSQKEEKLLSLASKSLSGPQQIFSAFNNADVTFEKVKDRDGHRHDLTHGLYHIYMESADRELRKSAFESMHLTFKEHEHFLSENLSAHVNAHVFTSKARGYESCLHSALYPHDIDCSVYHLLIETVRKRLGSLHKYVSYRRNHLNLNKVHAYDMYVPCAKEVKWNYSFDQATQLIVEAVKILGPEYQEILEKGLKHSRWVDRYENARKRSGAYSSGCYDSYPYILMNYHGSLSDVLTLAHEAGHSMHSFLSHKHQPYQYSSYTIFLAEVASTFNEELVFRLLLEKASTEEEKQFLINKRLDGIRGTLFRQTLFAEFEWKMHSLAEKGEALTPKTLRELYKNLNKDYYGPDFCHDDLVEYEFLRIPHFYSQFYVYQYATGISAALALVEKTLKEKNPAPYLAFLSSGCHDTSLNLLNKAGVDMKKADAVNILIDQFEMLLTHLK